MKKHGAYGAAAILIIGLTVSGMNLSHARFFDRDTSVAQSQMALVDVELDGISLVNDIVRFTLHNNSNINIYLRAGLIFEAMTEDGNRRVLTDMSNISVTNTGKGWTAVHKEFKDVSGISYKKWFLEYAEDGKYIPITPESAKLDAEFNISGVPEGYILSINVVPETIQADDTDEALNYLKSDLKVYLPW